MNLNPYHPIVTKTKYLLRVPATAQIKKHSERRYLPIKGNSYAYLGFDSKKNLRVHLCINTVTGSTRITLSKWSLLQILKLSLILRPIDKPKDAKIWSYDNNLAEFLNDMENVDFSAEDLRKKLLKTEVDLRVFMAKAPRRQKDAEKLLEEILYLERRIQALAAVEKIERNVRELTASEV